MAQQDANMKMAKEPEEIAGTASMTEPEIHTIPDKFYGAALKARIVEKKPEAPIPGVPGAQVAAMVAPPKTRGGGGAAIVIVLILLLLGAGGGFVYFNQSLLFGAPSEPEPEPTPEPPKPPPPPPVPTAPTNLSATATSPNVVQIAWEDTSDNEAGFRVERREPTTSYGSVTSLPPNSTAFQDRSVQPERIYLYRVLSVNAGGESPASNEASAETPALPPLPPEPEKLPPAGLDSDSDGLTDLEEPLYGTSSRDPDADKDTFLDGNEVFHLYNPAGVGGQRLLESNLVKEFESPVGWTVYVLTPWTATLTDNGRKGMISTGHGEFFTIELMDNPDEQSILDWYLARNPGVLSSQVVMIRTKSGLDGLEGADLLTTYFAWGTKVLVFRYSLDDQPFVNFRQTYEMMKNSLTLTSVPILPEAPAPAPLGEQLPPVIPSGEQPEAP
jgi:hypothetical protein